MSDPRINDPRYNPSQFSDPVDRRGGTTWGWVAGLVVIALIALFLIVGGHGNNNTASLPPGAPGSGSVTSPSTTGMGTPAPAPVRPATPTTPAPTTPKP